MSHLAKGSGSGQATPTHAQEWPGDFPQLVPLSPSSQPSADSNKLLKYEVTSQNSHLIEKEPREGAFANLTSGKTQVLISGLGK